MSWLQSSLGFAKTAISQAQKSIDKVLDIKDEHDVLSPGMQVEDGISGPEPDPPTGTTPSLGSWTTSIWSTPAKEEQTGGTLQSAQKTGAQSADDDSFWSSFFDSPSKKQSLASPPSAMRKSPVTPSSVHEAPHSGSTPESRLQGKKKSGQKVLNAKSRRKLPHKAKSETEGGDGELSLGHPSKLSSSTTEESMVKEQERSQSTPTGEASVAGTISIQSLPTDMASLEEGSAREQPFSGGWQFQPLVSMDEVEGANAFETDTISAKSEVRETKDESSLENNEIVGTLVDLSEDVSQPVEKMSVSQGGERKTSPSSPSENQPCDPAGKDELLIRVDQPDGPGHKGAEILPSEGVDKREADEWSGGQLEPTSPQPDVVPPGDTLEESSSADVEYQPDVGSIEEVVASAEIEKPSGLSESCQPVASEDTKIDASSMGHVAPHQVLLDSCSVDEEQGPEDDTGHVQVERCSPLSPHLPSQDEVLSPANGDSSEAGQYSEELKRREEAHEEFEEERSHPGVREEGAPSSEAPADVYGGLLDEDQLLHGQFLSSPEGRREEKEEEFMTPATSLVPLLSAGSQTELDTQLKNVQEELRETRHILEVRKQKLMDLSQANANLNADNDGLRSELAFAREQQRSGESSTEELKEEFTQRISAAEKKLAMVLKEKEALKKQLQGLETQKTSMSDKDEEITALREEGEKLSKQQLQSSNTIKKLRAKDQENRKIIAGLREKLGSVDVEVSKLKEALLQKEESDQELQGTLSKLSAFAEQQAQELSAVKSERDALLDKSRSLQTNLDNVFKELADLKKASAASDNAIKEATLSAEMSAKEELKAVMEAHKREALQEKDQLLLQIADLRAGLSRADQQASWREDQLRQEIAALQNRLQEAESRNEELSASVSQATKPLLRQLENLQAIHSTQAANWEMVEGSLTERLGIAQAHASEAMEKEREFAEKEMALQSRITSLEAQVKGLRQDKTKQEALLEAERAKLAALEEGSQKAVLKLESVKAAHMAALDQLRKEKETVEQQLDNERAATESKVMEATAKAQEKERQKVLAEMEVSGMKRHDLPQHETGLSRSVSVESSGSFWESSFSKASQHSGPTTAPLLEHYQSQLRQKEGELANTHSLLSSLEGSRAALTEEVAQLSAKNETLEERVRTIPTLQAALKEMHTRNETLLQMYGEKSEQAEELRLDLADVKEMYRQQIQDLLLEKEQSHTRSTKMNVNS